MPLWARCGAREVNRNDQEGPEAGGDQETVDSVGQGGGMLEGIVRNVASLISDAVWGYFKPAQNQKQTCTKPCDAADLPTLQIENAEEIPQPSHLDRLSDAAAIESLPLVEVTPSSPLSEQTSVNDGAEQSSGQTMPDRACLQQEHSSFQSKSRECLDGVDDIDEVLSSTLGALYGRATPAVVKQAWEVFSDSYGGDVSRFKSEYLTPVLELLHKVQEIQDTGEVPNSTWPLSVGSSVVVHLSRTNCRYLQDIGDFCISAVLDKPHGHPAIIVSSLTFDGVAEREVDEQDYGLLLTMDWARRIREATDRELVFLLRQCMVASEYSVRHLRWDEIPHLDPRNLNNTTLHLVLSDIGKGNGNANSSSLPSSSDSEANLTAGVHEDQKDEIADIGLPLPGCCQGESDSNHFALSDNLVARRALDDTVINTKADQNCPACSDPLHNPLHNPLHSKQCPSGSTVCQDSLDSLIPFDVCDRTDCKVVQQETPSPQLSANKDNSPALSRSLHQQSSASSPSSKIRAQSKYVPTSSPTPSSLSGGNYYGTWHGNRKGSHAQRRADGGTGSRSSVAAADVGDSSGCCHHRHVSSSSPRRAPAGEHLNNPRDCQHNMVDGLTSTETSSCGSATVHRSLEAPALISQVDSEILSSGVAILPGCVDEDGRCLVYIFTCSSLWHERRVSSTELARLLMYYYSVPRKKPTQKGMAIVADIRGVTPSTINVLLEALNLFQENIPGSVAVVHLFADKSAQACVIKSPLYDARAHVNLKVVLSLDHLQQYVNPTQIPTVLDGDYPYNHESWVRFQKKLEAFMSSCRTVACRLVDAMQEISSCEHMPQSVAESADMIRTHDQMVKLAFEDERLLTLQSDGPGIMSALMREEDLFANSEYYRYAMEQATELYQDLQETVSRLARLADEHMTKLHNCLQLREYEDECHKVIDWLSQDGETILQRHAATADNLKAARHQQKDFEKFYYSAVSYIEKGNDLLEEASMLSQCGSFSEATGYKDLAKTLRRQLQNFTGQLEEARERIEGTAKCYHLLDKSYEWALEAMKYMSSMKMEHSTTAEGLDKLLKSLSIYLSEHPAISEDTFVAMLEAAQRLNNDRLLEQCKLAKARCQETHKLLQLRHATLRRARIQMGGEQVVNEDPRDKNPSLYSVHIPRVMEAPLARQHSQTDRTNNTDLSQNSQDSPSSFTPPSSVKGIASEVRAQSGDVVCPSSPWQPQDSSTPTFSDLQSTCDGPQVTPVMGFKSKNRSDHALRVSISAAPFFHTQAESASLCSTDSSNSSPTKIPFSASFSSPLSSSSTQYVPTSISLPVSPTLSASEAPARARLYQPPSPMSRVYNSSTRVSAPSAASDHARPTARRPLPNAGSIAAASTTAPARPHKKILKRASTAPIPMLTSPILEEDAGAFGHTPVQAENSGSRSEGNGAREQRSSKSLSVITSSTESLPSMPEEDEEEADLNMSPSRDHQDLSSGSSVKDWTPVPVNTHLHRSARGTPTGPMADLNLSEAEMKSRRTVSLIMSEMIQTERDYVRALQFITDHYVPELQRDDVPQMLRGKRTVIFGNLEKIHQFHSHYFLKQLESCQNQPFLVGQYFLQHETMFYLYALYNKNKPKSDCLMTEYGKEFFRQKQLELGDKMDLSSYLLKPVQRMGKYALLLKQLLKECSETELEYPELKAAEEMVKFQLRHGNDLLAMDSLRDCDVNLQEQGRLLRQEEFLVFQGRKKSMRRIFLFEDLILFSKTRRGRQGQHDIYIYKTSFKTADIGLTENYGESGYKFEIWFRRRSVGENYVLQAPSSEVKKAWVKDISRLLWRQAIRNRESRINELATMGIGNKPCMDIKPSEDNIQDRSVNVALANRGARTRNSIAVSSFDYLRNGNKRPHSIISVSSTSSSGSSQSSFGLLGSLNLAFDPLDSPRMNRRSFISNESGIATDSDASACDLGVENKGPTPSHTSQSNVASLNSVRSYFDVMKSRVLKQKFSDQLFTDV